MQSAGVFLASMAVTTIILIFGYSLAAGSFLAGSSTNMSMAGSSGNSSCDESTTTPAITPAEQDNLSTPRFIGLSISSPCCSVELYIHYRDSLVATTNASTATLHLDNASVLRTGAWFHTGCFGCAQTMGIDQIQNDTLNVTASPSVITTSNYSKGDFRFNFDFTVTIRTSPSTKGFYMIMLPGGTRIPLAIGYDVSQINLTRDYPGFEGSLPPPELLGYTSTIELTRGPISLGYLQD